MNVRDWSFFSSKEGKKEIKEHILNTVSLWGAMGLFWYAFVSMIEEHFPEFLIGMDWGIILLWLVILWLGYEWPQKYLKKLVVPCRAAGVAIPIIYIFVNAQKIIDGFFQLAQIYLPFVNSYYKTRFFLEPANSGKNSVIAFTAICMLLWWMIWLLAYGCKKRILLALFPVFALTLELVVGLSPLGNGMLYWFFGGMVLAIMGGSSVVKKVLVLTGVGLSLLLAEFFFGGSIQSLATKEMKQAVLDWQENLSLEDLNPLKLLQLDIHFNWEQLSNNSPQYTGKVVLEIEADRKPQDSIYLKGFYGTNYRSGNWEYDDSYFKKACKEAGLSEQEVAQYLFDLPYFCFKENADIMRYEIKSVGTTGNVAYAPYFSNYVTFDEPYEFMGDFLLKKNYFDDYVKVKAAGDVPNLYDAYTTSPYYEIWNDQEAYEKRKEELSWYNSLAEAYLEVPEDMEFIQEVTDDAVDLTAYMPSYGAMGYSEKDKAYYVALDIKNYLNTQMSYSLILDDLPNGTDAIEYALLESHEGYCMHFASAATLMLREAGVPARYVSGYVVNPSEFEETENGYKAEVQDYNAHAWVEIYMEDIGWMPFEVTPGYSSYSTKHPTEYDPEEYDKIAEERREYLNNQENSESETTENTEEESESESTSEENTQVPANTENTDNKTGTGTGNDNEGAQKILEILLQGLKFLVILGGLVAIVFGLKLAVKQWKIHYEAVLEREIEKKQARRAIKRMNRRIYQMLRIRNIGNPARVPITGRLSDEAYEKALYSTFPDISEEEWNRYMEVVKKNHYSNEGVSVEEMQYVYECYKKVNLFNKSLTMPWHNKG